MHLYDLQTSEDERLYLYCLLEKIMIIVYKKRYRLCNRHNCAENTCIAEILRPTVFIK